MEVVHDERARKRWWVALAIHTYLQKQKTARGIFISVHYFLSVHLCDEDGPYRLHLWNEYCMYIYIFKQASLTVDEITK